ncbi:MAG: hypothetical protein H8D45_01560 [Bacteroidetes bacterium]|nr:hypothetical protein [Bacteroidota bacterium]
MNVDACERKMTVEEMCECKRKEIKRLKQSIVSIFNDEELTSGDNSLEGANLPPTRNANIKANLTLAFRHLEDARMRLGKVMQAYQGGISILDKR